MSETRNLKTSLNLLGLALLLLTLDFFSVSIFGLVLSDCMMNPEIVADTTVPLLII